MATSFIFRASSVSSFPLFFRPFSSSSASFRLCPHLFRSSKILRPRPLTSLIVLGRRPESAGLRCLSTRPTTSSLNDPSPNWSNRPPKETILLDGCDFEHWLVVMEPPEGNPTRDEIIDSYIKTLSQVIGSEDEARMKIYSVSTKHYFAFGCLVSEELSYKIKALPKVRWVLPDSYLDVKNKDYGGEPFIDGKAVPYDPKYHEEWVRNNARANERSRRNDRPRNFDRSRNFERRRENMQNRDFQNRQTSSPMPNHDASNSNMPPREAPAMGNVPNMGSVGFNGPASPSNGPGGAYSNTHPPSGPSLGYSNVTSNSGPTGGFSNVPPSSGPSGAGYSNITPNSGPSGGGYSNMPPPPNSGPSGGGYSNMPPPPNSGPSGGGFSNMPPPPNTRLSGGGYSNLQPSSGHSGGYSNIPPSGGTSRGYPNQPPSGGYSNMPASGGGYSNMPNSSRQTGGYSNTPLGSSYADAPNSGSPSSGYSNLANDGLAGGYMPSGSGGYSNMPNSAGYSNRPMGPTSPHDGGHQNGNHQNSYTQNRDAEHVPSSSAYQGREMPGRD